MSLFLGECGRKKAYSTYNFAEKIRLRCEAERGTKLRVYNCRYCQRFHLTKDETYSNQNAVER
jgi:hypothetical protein